MISPQVIIDRIKDTSGYSNVNWLEELSPDLFEDSDLPYIRVGFHSEESTSPNKGLSYGTFYTENEDIKQIFVIQIVSSVRTFVEVRQNIFGKDEVERLPKLIGWNPYPNLENSSAINLISGTVIGLSQGRQKVQYLVSCGYPIFGV